MPTITKLADFKFSVQQFLDACSPIEILELQMLLQSSKYQEYSTAEITSPVVDVSTERQQ